MSGHKPSKRMKAFRERQERRDAVERKRVAAENTERLRLEEIQRIERIRVLNQEHREYVETQFKSAMVENPSPPRRSAPYRRSNLMTVIAASLLLCTVPTEVKGDE